MASVFCAVSVFLMLAFVVVMVVVQTWAVRTQIGYDDRGIVAIGDVWLFVGESTARRQDATCDVYVVEKPNDSVEAGPDSWVMWPADAKSWEPIRTTRRAYMHHGARVVKSEWQLLRRCGVTTRAGIRWREKQDCPC